MSNTHGRVDEESAERSTREMIYTPDFVKIFNYNGNAPINKRSVTNSTASPSYPNTSLSSGNQIRPSTPSALSSTITASPDLTWNSNNSHNSNQANRQQSHLQSLLQNTPHQQRPVTRHQIHLPQQTANVAANTYNSGNHNPPPRQQQPPMSINLNYQQQTSGIQYSDVSLPVDQRPVPQQATLVHAPSQNTSLFPPIQSLSNLIPDNINNQYQPIQSQPVQPQPVQQHNAINSNFSTRFVNEILNNNQQYCIRNRAPVQHNYSSYPPPPVQSDHGYYRQVVPNQQPRGQQVTIQPRLPITPQPAHMNTNIQQTIVRQQSHSNPSTQNYNSQVNLNSINQPQRAQTVPQTFVSGSSNTIQNNLLQDEVPPFNFQTITYSRQCTNTVNRYSNPTDEYQIRQRLRARATVPRAPRLPNPQQMIQPQNPPIQQNNFQQQTVVSQSEVRLEPVNGLSHTSNSTVPPPANPSTGGGNNPQIPVSVSSTTTRISSPSLNETRTTSAETNSVREFVNKACQFDGRPLLMMSRSLNATVEMKDNSCQTEEVEKQEVRKDPVLVDRASSPIIFPEEKKVPAIKRKFTVKKRKSNDEKVKEIHVTPSGSDTDIDVVE